MRCGRRWWVVAAVAALAVVALVLTAVLPPAVPVAIAERRPLVQRLVVTGRVLAPARIEIGPLLAGNVTELAVEEGDRDEAGDLLLPLEDEKERAAADEARAALAEAQARLDQLLTVQAPQARAVLERSRAKAEQARSQYERIRALHEGGASSDAALEEAERGSEVAQAELERARSELQGVARGADVRVARAGVERAEAALRRAEVRLSRTELLAPAPGQILRRLVERGQGVQPGQVLLELAAQGTTEIALDPDERNLAQLQGGQEVVVSADAYPADRFQARVLRIGPGVDRQQGTVEVRLVVPDPPAYLRPGMTVSADLEVGRADDALVLPAVSVREARSGRPWALVIENGRAVRRQLRLGVLGERWIQILDGVELGEAAIPAFAEVEAGARVRAGEGVSAPPGAAP